MESTWGMDIRSWKTKAKLLRTEIVALYSASKHPGTPWYAKVLAVLIIGYALSPIDLIPDFIPVAGYLDDLIILPAGVALLIKIIPRDVLEECRAKAQSDASNKKSKKWVAGIIIVLIWLLAIYLILSLIWPLASKTTRTSVANHKSLSFICHSGLDPESSVSWLDSRFRGNDGLAISVKNF